MLHRFTPRFLPAFILALAFPAAGLTPVAARHAIVVSDEPLATDAGVEILRAGGNAADAAVAVGFALAVTDPRAGNLGGGGFMLIRMASGEAAVVDYREEAPEAATRNMYLDAQGDPVPASSRVGPLAVGVPGTVAGLALAEEKYGKLGLPRVLAPAIRLAEEGFPVSYALAQSLQQSEEHLSKFAESRRIFLRDGRPYEPGEIFRQPQLAQSLRLIAALGPDAFYHGPIAMDLVATMKSLNGLISLDDLAHYQAKLRQPLVGQFRGYTILTVPPPSSGGVALVEMLNILDPLDLDVVDDGVEELLARRVLVADGHEHGLVLAVLARLVAQADGGRLAPPLELVGEDRRIEVEHLHDGQAIGLCALPPNTPARDRSSRARPRG